MSPTVCGPAPGPPHAGRGPVSVRGGDPSGGLGDRPQRPQRRDRAGLAATVITYRVRSAVRDVGKALLVVPQHLVLIQRLRTATPQPSQV